jgi:hypothetical protein
MTRRRGGAIVDLTERTDRVGLTYADLVAARDPERSSSRSRYVSARAPWPPTSAAASSFPPTGWR